MKELNLFYYPILIHTIKVINYPHNEFLKNEIKLRRSENWPK
jgi:hypothetical protein